MTTNYMNKLKTEIETFGDDDSYSIDDTLLLNHPLDSLDILAGYMSQDLAIRTIERFEKLFKKVLKKIFSTTYSSDTAREVILIQKRLGFILKYKSYAIKASSPLGYSVFIQNKGQGFSFQQHISHKTEVFHILDVQDGGYVFICDYDEWDKYFDEKSFRDWLEGKPDERYDRFRIYPEPGDLFPINKLGVVHTVVGCLLEEYATVSTDMVDRLFDQNKGSEIPDFFSRDYFQKMQKSIKFPENCRNVDINSGQTTFSKIEPLPIQGGIKLPLCHEPITASRYRFEPLKSGEPMVDDRCASCIYITQGKGQLFVGDKEEINRITPPSIEVSAGELLLIPHGTYYSFICEGSVPLELSEQKIPFDVAFV